MGDLILVTGGTGRLGRPVVAGLRAAGHDVRVLSRKPRPSGPGVHHVAGDLVQGTGVAAALGGVATVVHCASDDRGDVAAARHLVEAARGGVEHLVYVSIVGVDRVAFGYTKAKLACEEIVAGSGVPHTILRATQFHAMVRQWLSGLTRLPVVPVPSVWDTRPVDEHEVAARLVALAQSAPAGRVPDFGGPRVETFAGLVRTYLSATGRRRPVVPLPVPGTRAIRQGALLPAAGADFGTRTWADYLAEN
jgi:uncharacterized protein YbjT (DUF2867 family)